MLLNIEDIFIPMIFHQLLLVERKDDLYSIEPLNIDQGCKYYFIENLFSFSFFNEIYLGKYWVENPLKYFTFPWNMTRDQAFTFCTNNHGTLMFWNNLTEQNILQSLFSFDFSFKKNKKR